MARIIEATRTTPFVRCDSEEGVFEISGRSSPDVSINFYNVIYDMLEEYPLDSGQPLTANFALEYFNTSSTKCLVGVMKRLSDLQNKGVDMEINWHYEEDDEDILEIGEDLSYIANLEFNYVEVETDLEDEDFIF